MTNKTHWKKNFNYDYLGAYSLNPSQELILTIKKIVVEEVKDTNGKSEQCLVAHFEENQKPMVLNKTNCKAIQKAYDNPMIEDWIGKQIQVYATKVRAFGEDTDALRVRAKVPQKVDTKREDEIILEIGLCDTIDELTALSVKYKSNWTPRVKQSATNKKEEINAK